MCCELKKKEYEKEYIVYETWTRFRSEADIDDHGIPVFARCVKFVVKKFICLSLIVFNSVLLQPAIISCSVFVFLSFQDQF